MFASRKGKEPGSASLAGRGFVSPSMVVVSRREGKRKGKRRVRGGGWHCERDGGKIKGKKGKGVPFFSAFFWEVIRGGRKEKEKTFLEDFPDHHFCVGGERRGRSRIKSRGGRGKKRGREKT